MGNDYFDYRGAWNKAEREEKPDNDKSLYKLVRSECFSKFLIEKINEEHISNKLKPKCPDNALLPYYLYFCVYFERFNCPKKDFYIAYLFDKKLSKVFLTLVLGSSNDLNFDNLNFESDFENIRETKTVFKEKIDKYKSDISSQFNIDLDDYNDEIFLDRFNSNDDVTDSTVNTQNKIAENYENGAIYVKSYDIAELPSEEELIEDFNNFIKIYYFILNKFFKDEFWGFKHNLIYFGAPGTGKSYSLNKDKNKLIKNENYERVTFHPDYSYANFVGTYKPVPVDDENENDENDGTMTISYEYVPGPFICLLIDALKNPDDYFLLIIEEINRANVAAVFGDIFQLLDRDESNESRYPINIPHDMKKYFKKKGISDKKLKIPSNFYIWATMNSADQGVFPMDTAFKRRWDFKYLGINQGQEKIEDTYVVFNNRRISWNKLRIAINKQLLSEEYNVNEDKLLGPFFAFNKYLNKEIPVDVFKETFQNKIIMYLFEDAARPRRNELFEGVRGDLANVTYSEICRAFEKDIGLGIFNFIRISDILMDEEE